MWGDGCVHWVHGKISFCVYLYQIIALYTLPVLQFCQLYPIKAEVKKVSASGIVTKIAVVVAQSLSHVRLFATPWIAAREASLSVTNSRTLLKLMSIESVVPSSHLILCHPLLLLSPIPPPSILGRFILRYFILFVAMVNGIVPLTSLSDFPLLVYRSAGGFCALTLHFCDFTKFFD